MIKIIKCIYYTIISVLSIFFSTGYVEAITLAEGVSVEDSIELARKLRGTYSIARGYFKGQDPLEQQSVQSVHFVSKKHVLALHRSKASIESIRCDFPDHEPFIVKVIEAKPIKPKICRDKFTLFFYELEREIEQAIPFKIIKERNGIANLLQSDIFGNNTYVLTYSNAKGNAKNFELKAVRISGSEQTNLWKHLSHPFGYCKGLLGRGKALEIYVNSLLI